MRDGTTNGFHGTDHRLDEAGNATRKRRELTLYNHFAFGSMVTTWVCSMHVERPARLQRGIVKDIGLLVGHAGQRDDISLLSSTTDEMGFH